MFYVQSAKSSYKADSVTKIRGKHRIREGTSLIHLVQLPTPSNLDQVAQVFLPAIELEDYLD